jgi:pyruvate kinase
MRRTKIVCTIGPATSSPEGVRSLIAAGMDVARLNFSHGDHASHAALFGRVREAAAELGRNVAVLTDLQGPKIRTGRLRGGLPVTLVPGADIEVVTGDIEGTADRIATTYEALPSDVRPGDRILIADGAIELRVVATGTGSVRCKVVHGGPLGQHKGINLPGVAVSAPSLTEKDREDLAFALELGADFIALSFVRHPDDLREMRRIIDAAKGHARIVAKIERPEALAHIDEIITLADAIMVARGDLGVEVPLQDVPRIQKDLIHACNARGVPVITATQMLESMMQSPRPTRAEVNDVANAIYDGTDAVMLSGETAAGSFPMEAVRIMAEIATRTDEDFTLPPRADQWTTDTGREAPFTDAIGHAVSHIADCLDLSRIVCLTSSGYTAAMIARYRPKMPVTAFTISEEARRRCALIWGVDTAVTVEMHHVEEVIPTVERHLLDSGLARPGDTLAIVAGTPLAVGGRTNLLKLHTVGEEPEHRKE